MAGSATSGQDAVTSRDHPQRQVGVLAVGTWKPLVEATDGDQCVTPVGHVGGDPPRRGESLGAALVIGGTPAGRRRHLEDALRTDGARGLGGVQVVGQPGQPIGLRQNVIVEEDDPPARRSPPSDVSGGGRPATATAQQGERKPGLQHQVARRIRAVVDNDDLGRLDFALLIERSEQPQH
jgi:hypothetical protein